MHDDVMLNGGFVYGLLLGNCGYKTDRVADVHKDVK